MYQKCEICLTIDEIFKDIWLNSKNKYKNENINLDSRNHLFECNEKG